LAAIWPARASLISAGPDPVTTFRVYEISLDATSPSALPYRDGPTLSATFTHTSGTNFTVNGFWDGGNTWRLRFAPNLPGAWTWSTSSTDAGLTGISSNFSAMTATSSELEANPLLHGFIKRDGYAWRLSDNSLFVPVGDTQWSFSEEFFLEEIQAWMEVLKSRGVNTLHGCAWLAKYTRGGLNPFNGLPSGDSLNPAFFQRLDQMIQYANDRAIMVGLCIGGFPANSTWWSLFNTQARDDRWFRYIVDRYAALNVRWVLYGEVNEGTGSYAPPWGATWQSEVAHKAGLIKAEDPYRHPIGSHGTSVDTSSINDPNVDYLEVQIARTETQFSSALGYRSYGKPIWFEEYWYEPASYDNDYTLGIRNTHRNFIAALVFPTFGSLMRAHSTYPEFPPTNAPLAGMTLQDYLLSFDQGLKRMQYFAGFARDLNTGAFSPAGTLVNRGQCGKFGNDYAIFLQGGGSVVVNLTNASGAFEVAMLDINTGATNSLGTVIGGTSVTINSGTSSDVSLILRSPAPTGPQMGVTGNGVHIPNGKSTPLLTDNTDFGSALTIGGMITRIFTVQNTGLSPLMVSNVVIAGSTDFTVTAVPAASIVPGEATTFGVTFDPSLDGLRTATVSVSNSDTNANPYTFAIQGTGVSITNGLAGYWKCDESNETLAGDSSGNNNNGTLFNGPVWVTGRFGNGLSFDGRNDYVDVGDPASGVLDFDASQSFSYGAWINPGVLDATGRRFISKRNGTGSSNVGFDLGVNAAQGLLAEMADGTTERTTSSLSIPLTVNQWSHAMVVVDRAAGQMRVYLDGVEKANLSLTGLGSLASATALNLGRATGDSTRSFLGVLDEVRIYRRALSAGEIQALVNPPAPVFLPPTQAGGDVILSWTGNGQLERALMLSGPWAAVVPAPSSPCTVPIILDTNGFFRLRTQP